MTVRDRWSGLSALAVLLSASALWQVFDTQGWLLRTAGAAVAVAVASVAARRLRLPAPAVPLVTAGVLAAYLVVVFVPGTLRDGVLPGPGTLRALRALLHAAGTDLSQYGPPAPPTTALVLLAAGGVGVVAVVVDALAAVAARPAAAGLPLLALFAVPSAVLPGGLSWLPFVLGAGGWLALLLAEGRDEQLRWGAPLRSAAPGWPGRAPASADPAGLSRVGRRIGGAALGVAVIVPALVPGLHGRLFGGSGDGAGGGGGSHDVVTYNPITRLRGELSLPEPVVVLRYRTDDPAPDYLRMTTLGIYDGGGWRQDVLRGNLRQDGVTKPVPTPVGRTADVPARTVTDQVTLSSLDAVWLPAPATPRTVSVEGPWLWDAPSESIFSTRSDTTRIRTYTVRASRVLPDPARLASGDAPVPAQIRPYTVPVPATDQVRALTARIVRGQTSDYGRAAAIQAYFRSPANGFRYSTQTASGSSPDALQDFLTLKTGFCEQYASAMGAMLRLAGVPSRVAVGFTPGARQPDGSYQVTTDQAHAWPEAWFQGAGWVRFEPTPSRGGITPPSYGAPAAPGAQAPTGAPAPSASAAPGAGQTRADKGTRVGSERADRAAPAPVAAGSSRRPRALTAGLAGLGLLLLAGPAALHALRRRRRWRTPGAGPAWEQLREDATDTGHPWDDAESPRAAALRLAGHPALAEGPAADALQRLLGALERARYARPGVAADPAGLLADSRSVRSALRRVTPRGRRLRSLVLPPSTLHWASATLGRRTADLLDAGDRLLGAAGSRLRRRTV